MIDLMQLLIKHEGVRLAPYRDTVGKLTIGVGRNLDDVGITQGEAFMLLHNDILACTASLTKAFPWFVKLDEVRAAVLIDMCFNMGVGGLKKFVKMLAAVERGEYEIAAKEMLNSTWAKQVSNRAIELASFMVTGKVL